MVKTKIKGVKQSNFSVGNKLRNPKQKIKIDLKKQKMFTNFEKIIKKYENLQNKENITMIKKKLQFRNTKKMEVEQISIINETLSSHSVVQINNKKHKCFQGKDLIDKIYFCPDDNFVILNYEEINKLGLLLLDSLRNENDFSDYNNFYGQIQSKYEEEFNALNVDKEKLLKEKEENNKEYFYIFYNLLSFSVENFKEKENNFKLSIKDQVEKFNKKINLSFSELNLLYRECKKFDIYQKDSGNSENFVYNQEVNLIETENFNNKGFLLESLEFSQNVQRDFSKLK